jgi:predicted aspartyl protease
MRRVVAVVLMCTIFCWIGVNTPTAQSSSSLFDGRWSATVGPQGGCGFTSILIIDVSGSSLVGYASNPMGVFPLMGTISAGGSGSFKIGTFVGTISFSERSFEAKYANNCGGRFAVGVRNPSVHRLAAPSLNGIVASDADPVVVPLVDQGDGYVAPVLINKAITLNFVVDSGATDIGVPDDVVSTLMRAGTISSADFIGERTYKLADGSTMPSKAFQIHSLTVGRTTVENVVGSVAPSQAELLLGQSFLRRFKSWAIDNSNHQLILAKFSALAN